MPVNGRFAEDPWQGWTICSKVLNGFVLGQMRLHRRGVRSQAISEWAGDHPITGGSMRKVIAALAALGLGLAMVGPSVGTARSGVPPDGPSVARGARNRSRP